MNHLQLTEYPVHKPLAVPLGETLPSIHCRATYAASLLLVADIDAGLTSGRRRFRNRAGMLLTNLDEVIRAILADDLA